MKCYRNLTKCFLDGVISTSRKELRLRYNKFNNMYNKLMCHNDPESFVHNMYITCVLHYSIPDNTNISFET